MDALTSVAGNGQRAGRREEFGPLTVLARAGGEPTGGQMVSFFVDDPEGTGTDFRGGSPVRITTASDGTGTTDVPLIAGESPGAVRINVIADGANTSFSLQVE